MQRQTARIGIRTIGVLCGGFPEADSREAGCIAIYRESRSRCPAKTVDPVFSSHPENLTNRQHRLGTLAARG